MKELNLFPIKQKTHSASVLLGGASAIQTVDVIDQKRWSATKSRILHKIRERETARLLDEVASCLAVDLTIEQFVNTCSSIMAKKDENEKQAFTNRLWTAFSRMGGEV